MRPLSAAVALFLLAAFAHAQSSPAVFSAQVSVNTDQTTPLHANFSGFNDEVPFPPEFYDYRLNDLATQLSPRWVRYPSGLFSQAFKWQTGLMVPAWVAQFQGTNPYNLLDESIAWVGGKGGASFVDGAARADFLGASLIVDVNGYTDTAQSAGQMAAFAKANGIRVAVWELSNEPYLYKSFFSSATDYLNKMKPYRDAIKAANPNAVVAIFADDAGDTNPNPPWNQAIAAYASPYWDAVTYHHYPPQSSGDFNQWMADENAVLASRSSAYITGYLALLLQPGTQFLISEFLPSNDGLGSGTSVTDGTLYGAIYAAEYVMRMSSVPQMLYVGMHALTGSRGVFADQTHYTDVTNAFNAGASIDTLSLNFGYYLTAQPLGLAVLNGVLRNATAVDATTVTGGATVPATGLGTIPALYAQAYTGSTGLVSVVISNKSASVHAVTVQLNGAAVVGPLTATMISGTDPTVQNTAASTSVSVQSSTLFNPVTLPAYSVVRVDLNLNMVASAVSNASYAAGVVAPWEIVSLFGNGIATAAASASLPLSTNLGGLTVPITDSTGNTALAQLFAVAPNQVNILIPSGLAPGQATFTIHHTATPPLAVLADLSGTMTIAPSAPGLYSANSDGAGVAAADAFLYTDAGQIENQTVFTCNASYARSCLPAPLSQGAPTDTLYVELYGTGIRSASSVECYVAGQSVPVLYAGAAPVYAGLDQVNISVPKSLTGTGDARVYLIAGGVASNAVVLKLQ
jgi:uncharacterized protein (TIGR03437 family)